MGSKMKRREFLQTAAIGGAMGLGVMSSRAGAATKPSPVISPGCRRSKVRVARLYMGKPQAHWPTPTLDLQAERQKYEAEFARLKGELADVEFVVDELVSSEEQAQKVKERLGDVDGVLIIHLAMGVGAIVPTLLAAGRPTVIFAVPYSGHEWVGYGALRKKPEGALLECLLTADYTQLAAAIRPFRAIHHLREAKVLDVTTRALDEKYVQTVKDKFGTEIKRIDRETTLAAYEAVPDAQARAEAKRWIEQATQVVEPSEEEVFKSCKLALAMQKLLDDEDATMITIDCYGTMWRQLPAYPCIGHARLNNMGLGGMCESDLRSAMTQILLQGLSGKPGFVNDPTMDVSTNSIVLAHCMGTPRMDGPEKPAAPYKLRTIMERQEGAVCQVKMQLGQKVTTAELIGTDLLVYFIGEIIDTPDLPRGCRTKIAVKVDGDAEKLWQNWQHGLHRVTCYGDLTADLKRFCRFKGIEMQCEA